MFPHKIFFYSFFFLSRGATQQVFLRFNVTPSANFLVCSKCVTGDSQQDRNARAYYLVKQENKQKNSDRVTNKTLQNINQTEKKTKNSKQKTMLEANEAIHVSFK